MEPQHHFAARPRAAILVLALIGLVPISMLGCGSSGPAVEDEPRTPAGSEQAAAQNTRPGAIEETVVVDASEFKFAPATIRVPAGKPVKIVLNNGGRIEHEILIRDLPGKIMATQAPHEMHSSGEAGMKAMSEDAEAGRFHVHAGPGDQASEVFQADAPGTYDFACEIPGHKEAGMVGRIEVQS